MALHLNLRDIIVEAISAIPASEVEVVSASVPRPFLQLYALSHQRSCAIAFVSTK